jgi:hypothetical protein
MNKEEEIKLLADVKSITDKMVMVDEVFKAKGMGRNLVVAFRCNHSGLYFSGDYLREWGRKYGIGLGGVPVSECLDTDYYGNIPEFGAVNGVNNADQIAYPVRTTFASLDHELVDESFLLENALIPAFEDPRMEKRMKIIIPKQIVNVRSNLSFARAKSRG